MGSSTLYRVLEPISDAASGVARAREILKSLADGPVSDPWVQMDPLETREQFEHALTTVPRAQVFASSAHPDVPAFLENLRRHSAVFEREEPSYRFAIELELRSDLADLWPLPKGFTATLQQSPPFGRPEASEEDESTEEELDVMIPLLGPLTLDIRWSCAWRGLPKVKLCGLQLCLNGTWKEQYSTSVPGEHGLWISIGDSPENRAVSEEWRKTCGLGLGGPQGGW